MGRSEGWEAGRFENVGLFVRIERGGEGGAWSRLTRFPPHINCVFVYFQYNLSGAWAPGGHLSTHCNFAPCSPIPPLRRAFLIFGDETTAENQEEFETCSRDGLCCPRPIKRAVACVETNANKFIAVRNLRSECSVTRESIYSHYASRLSQS